MPETATATFLSVSAQQGIAFFIMAAVIVGLCCYVLIMEQRNTRREARETAREEARAKREDEREHQAAQRYAALVAQIMEQQRTMMDLLFGVINRNSNVQEKIVEKLDHGPGNAPTSGNFNG